MNCIASVPAPLNIAVLAYPGCCIGDVVKLLEALHGLHARPCCSQYRQRRLITRVYSVDGAPMRSPFIQLCSVGTQSIDTALPDPLDTLIIANAPQDSVRQLSTEVLRWLRAAQPKARRVVALGAGVFWLAAAGLLHQRRVTTRGALTEQLRRQYPTLRIDSASHLQIDGPFYTANERLTATDLAEVLLRDHCDSQATHACRLLDRGVSHPGTSHRLCQWWVQRIDSPLDMYASARQLNISERHLRRQVKEETGFSPSLLLVLLRLDMARQALLDSDLPVDKVARRGGLRDGQQLARLFRKYLGPSPQEYRRDPAMALHLHPDYQQLFDGRHHPGWLSRMLLETRAQLDPRRDDRHMIARC